MASKGPKKKRFTKVAEGTHRPLAVAERVSPLPLVLPSWIPRRYRRANDFQVFSPLEANVDFPKGYSIAWYDPTDESKYFKLYATVFPPKKRKKSSREWVKKWEALVVAERIFGAISVIIRRRIVVDRETGVERNAPGYRADWSQDGVKYLILDHGAALKVEQLFRIASSMKVTRTRRKLAS